MEPLIKNNSSGDPAAPSPNDIPASNPASAATPPIAPAPVPKAPVPQPAPAAPAPSPAPKAPVPEPPIAPPPAPAPTTPPPAPNPAPAAPPDPVPVAPAQPLPSRPKISGGQRYRGNGQLRASGFTANAAQAPNAPAPNISAPNAPVPAAPDAPVSLAQPIVPTSIDDAPIIINNDTKKSSSNKTTIIVTILVVIVAFAAGIAVGHLLFNNDNKNIGGTNNVQTPEPTAETKSSELTAEEKTDLSKKVSWLLMAESAEVPATAESLRIDDYRNMLPKVTGNNLIDSDKLGLVVYSLQDKYTDEVAEYTDKNGAKIEGYTVGPSKDEVNKRYKEIFGTSPAHASSADDFCPRYAFDEARGAYLISTACGGSTGGIFDLLYKSNFELTDDGATATVAVGSSTAATTESEAPGVYNDYRASTTKTLLTPASDFSTPEELAAFTITSDNADQFTQYQFVFTQDDSGNFVFKQVKKA